MQRTRLARFACNMTLPTYLPTYRPIYLDTYLVTLHAMGGSMQPCLLLSCVQAGRRLG